MQKQREKGAEHVDFRKKEEEAKEQAKRDENKAERERKRQVREQRKQAGRATVGLDAINEGAIEAYREKVKVMHQFEPVKPLSSKGVSIAPPTEVKQRPYSSKLA